MFVFRTIVALFIAVPAFAGTLVTRDGKTLDGELTVTAPSAIKIVPSSGEPITLELSNVRRASFVVPATATQPVAWSHADVGKVHLPGTASENDGAFALS